MHLTDEQLQLIWEGLDLLESDLFLCSGTTNPDIKVLYDKIGKEIKKRKSAKEVKKLAKAALIKSLIKRGQNETR